MKPKLYKIGILALVLMLPGILHSEFITSESQTLKVWAEPIEMDANAETISTLTIYENDVKNYSAFNMVLTVPKGVTVAKVKQGRDLVDAIFLSQRGTDSHVISCNMLDDNQTIKIISYSSQISEYHPDDEDNNPLDELFSIGLIALPEMVPGEYIGEISDIKFVEANSDASVLPAEPVQFSILIVDGKPNAINRLHSVETDSPTYDILGRKVNAVPQNSIIVKKGQKTINR